eukprot:1182300-Prorocentrum_minimum.AAC.3
MVNFLDDARPPPTDPLGDASRRVSRRSACPIAWRGRATSRKWLMFSYKFPRNARGGERLGTHRGPV